MERALITIKLADVMRIVAAVATLVVAAACGGLASPTKSVQVQITSPAPNAEVVVGISTTISADVNGDNITRVDVQIDGAPYAILTTDDKTKGMPSFPVKVPWAPNSEGVHVIQLIVYGLEAKVLTRSEPLIFRATTAAAAGLTAPPPTIAPADKADAATQVPAATTVAAPALTPGGVFAQVPTNTVVVTTAAPLVTVVPTPTPGVQVIVITVTTTPAGQALSGPALTVSSDSANVRSGPGTQYNVIGQLQNGANAAIRGKNTDGTWWQIAYASVPEGAGWLRSDLVQANGAASSVPVVTVPPVPTQPPFTPTPVQPTAAPTAAERPCDSNTPEWKGSDPHYPFCVGKVLTWYDNQDGAHRYENGHDVPASFSWDIWGVDSIWIVFEQDNSGYCGYTKQAAKTIGERVANTGNYAFNVKDFPGGATMRIFLNVKRKDGQVVEFGDKRLCIF